MDNSDTQKRAFKVQTLSNQIYLFQTDANNKVSDVKKLIFERTTIPANRQKLIFDSKVLDDGELIGTYLKQDDLTVFLMSRPQTNLEKQRKNPSIQDFDKQGFNQGFNQIPGQGFNQGFNTFPFSGNGFQQSPSSYYPYSSPPGMIPTFKIPSANTLVPFQQGQVSLGELSTLSQIINQLGQLPCPQIPVTSQNSSAKRLGQYLAQWHYETLRLLPYVYRLSQLLQKEDYLNQIGRLQTQQQIFNVSTALQASVNATVPLIMESNKVGSSINNFNPHFNFQRHHYRQSPYAQQQFPSYQPPVPNSDGSFDFHQYPFGFTNPYNPIPMGKAPPYWDGKPPKLALSIAYGEGDHSSTPLKQLVGNFNNLKSVWVQLFGDSTVGQLFFLLSGDDQSNLSNIRQSIVSHIDQITATKITRSLNNILVNQKIKAFDADNGLSSYIFERTIPHIELILHLIKQGKQNYSQQISRQIKSGLGQILYEIVQSTSKNIEFVSDSILSALKKTLSQTFPNTDTYFSLLSTKLKKGILEAYNEYQRKIQDERNRLII